MRDLPGELRAPCDWCYPCYTCRELMQDAADEIDRLNALFGSRFHLDTQCGSCNGPLECDRDAICHQCTDAMEIERLRTKLREIHQVASDPAFACDAMDWVLVILRRDESGEQAGNRRESSGSG